MKVCLKIHVQWQKNAIHRGLISFLDTPRSSLTKLSLGIFVNDIDLNANRKVM